MEVTWCRLAPLVITHILNDTLLCADNVAVLKDVLGAILLSGGLDLDLGYRPLDLGLGSSAHGYFVLTKSRARHRKGLMNWVILIVAEIRWGDCGRINMASKLECLDA